MGAIRYIAGLELRHTRRVVVSLTLLVGVGGALVLTLLAGARRADTSYERFRDVTRAADVSVAPSAPGPGTFDAIAQLPQVAATTRPVFPFVVPAGSGLYPFLDFNAVAYPDGKMIGRVDAVRIVEGRLPRLGRADEIAVINSFADETGLSIGDRMKFESYAPDQFEDLFGTGDVGAPAGPRVSATVTGIVDAPDFVSESEANFLPVVFLTPAFHDRHADAIAMYDGGLSVRLRNGQDDVAEFTAAVRNLLPDDDALEIQPASDVNSRIDDGLRVLVVGLLLCAACATLAAVVAIALTMARFFSRSPADLATMRSLGMTAGERVGASVAAMLPVAAGGAALAVVLAFAASPLMPVGIARDAEPSLGLSFDPLVLGLGCVVVAATVVAVAMLSAWRAGRFASRAEADDGSALARPFRRVTPITTPVARPVGVRMALEPGHGATAVPVRSAALGAVLGVMGVVGAVVFATSLSTTLDHPERFGFPWDAIVAGFEENRAEQVVDDLVDDRRVDAIGVLGTGIAVVGARDVNVYSFDAVEGRTAPTILDGRMVSDDEEVVLGARTARETGVGVGDTVVVRGSGNRYRLRVVGLAALPVLDDRSGVDIGAVVTPRRLRSVTGDGTVNRDVLVRWVPGLDAAAATRELGATTGSEVFVARLPSELGNLERVSSLPWALASFLAVVAALAVAHAVVSTVRRRRRDLAILRTLGFVDRQLSALVRWEGSTFALIGLVLGIPLGLVLGRVVWRSVAEGIGVEPVASTPVGALVVIALATVAVALAAAAVPAHRARRVHPATTLAVND